MESQADSENIPACLDYFGPQMVLTSGTKYWDILFAALEQALRRLKEVTSVLSVG